MSYSSYNTSASVSPPPNQSPSGSPSGSGSGTGTGTGVPELTPVQPLKYKRNYRACLNCRLRKVKCDLGPVDNPHDGKCARCLRERKDCVFVESKRGGSTNVINGKRKKQKKIIINNSDNSLLSNNQLKINKLPGVQSILKNGNEQIETGGETIIQYNSNTKFHHQQQLNQEQPSSHRQQFPPPGNKEKRINNEFSTMESALVFLANAAGEIAKADERDNIDAQTKYDQIEAAVSNSHRNSLDGNNNNSINNQSPLEKESPRYQSNGNTPTELTTTTTNRNNNNRSISRSTSNENLNDQGSPSLESNHQQEQSTLSQHKESIREIKSTIPPYINPTIKKRMIVPPAISGHEVRPKGSNKLSSIEYIGPNGILTEFEAEKLINLFFSTMHPYFPHIPKFLHSPTVLANYPILLCSILTISSRYHPFDDDNNNNTKEDKNSRRPITGSSTGPVRRNIEVHDRLWLYVQRLISQTVWAEASTRSIGTVFAFLLFTEWNPRAIHWRWSDYANKAEESNENDNLKPTTNTNNNTTTNATQNNIDALKNESPNKFAGLGAMRRSHRMAWMLIGSAVRLAQDMGFMEISAKTFLGTHIAEINSVMNISRRSMLANSLSEVDLDEDDITVEDMEQLEAKDDDDNKILTMNEEQIKRLSQEYILKFTKSQKATIELLQIMSLGHESLYGYKAQLGQLSHQQTLSVLNILSPLLNNWGKKYKEFLIPSNNNGRLAKLTPSLPQYWLKPDCKIVQEIQETIERETFIIEYNYVKLYIYSLALNTASSSNINNKSNSQPTKENKRIKLDELSKSAKYIEQAFLAANETLNAAHRIHRFKMLRFMPVRLLTRFIRAAAFIVQCHLTMTAQENISLSVSRITIDDIIKSTHRAAMTLRECSPDELHLLSRYSTILMVLYSEMKAKKNKTNHHQPQEQEQGQEQEQQQQQQEGGRNNSDDVLNMSHQQYQQSIDQQSNYRQSLVQEQVEKSAQQYPYNHQQDQDQEQQQLINVDEINMSYNINLDENQSSSNNMTQQLPLSQSGNMPNQTEQLIPPEDLVLDFNFDDFAGDGGFQNIVDLWSYFQ